MEVGGRNEGIATSLFTKREYLLTPICQTKSSKEADHRDTQGKDRVGKKPLCQGRLRPGLFRRIKKKNSLTAPGGLKDWELKRDRNGNMAFP